jgi:hypothetical protein
MSVAGHSASGATSAGLRGHQHRVMGRDRLIGDIEHLRPRQFSNESRGRPSAGGPLFGAVELVEAEQGELAGKHPRQRV